MAWALAGLAISAYSSYSSGKKADDAAASLNKGLDVKRVAQENGFNLNDLYGRKPDLPEFNFNAELPEFDFGAASKQILDFTKEISEFNSTIGTDNANRTAGSVNEQTLNDLEAGMRRLFGGGDTFDNTRDLANRNTQDWMEGRLSQPTRQLLGRQALSTGASGIGRGAVDDVYAGYLGLATEDIVGQGMDSYRSLYSMYRQSYPMVTGMDAMPFTSITPAQGGSLALNTAQSQYQAGLSNVQTQFQFAESNYRSALDRAINAAAPNPAATGLIRDEMSRTMGTAAAQQWAAQTQSAAWANTATAAANVVGTYAGI